MEHKPTAEMLKIRTSVSEVFGTKLIFGVFAFAGTGKTSVCLELICGNPSKTFLYIAFNNAAADDFNRRLTQERRRGRGGRCVSRTIHSLAKHAIQPSKIRGEYRAAEIAEMFGVGYQAAEKAKQIFEHFCNSAAASIGEMGGEATAKHLAEKLWDEMKESSIAQTHSFYLKEFSLRVRAGKISFEGFDCVILDEAQDTNAVTMDIFKRIPLPRIYVGDEHQSIYGFRGAINAMSKIGADRTFTLSANFRSSEAIIEVANRALRTFKGEPREIICGIPQTGGDCEANEVAYITRLNSTIVSLVKQHDSFRLLRSADAIFAATLAIYYWDREEDLKIPKEYSFLKKFNNREKIFKYIEETGDRELESAIRLVENEAKNGGSIFDIYEKAKQCHSDTACVVLATAHSSKGLEFDRVILTDDFPDLLDVLEKVADGEKNLQYYNEEANLYYVALTRAKLQLEDGTKNGKLLSGAEIKWVANKVKKTKSVIEARFNER